MTLWIAIALVLILIAAAAFVLIARAGRRLRVARRILSEADEADLESGDGKRYEIRKDAHFYLGRSRNSDLLLPDAPVDYQVCIFYHRKRFAFQVLSGSGQILLNGEEQLAGYLSNGDVLEIADKRFVFRCH